MSSIGTLAWTRRSGGRLTARERLAFTVEGMRSQLQELGRMSAHKLGINKAALARIDLDSVRLPDTPAAKAAEEVADQWLPQSLWHHSHRAYLWALALARVDGLEGFDEELLYCGCLVHDAGVPVAVERASDACFTLASAELGEECARRGGWPEERGQRLAEALTLHINGWLPPERGVEAHLLASGALVDGIGRRHWQVDPGFRQRVLERHPRLGVKQEMNEVMRTHAKQCRKGRIAFYYRYGALGPMIKRAPFDS